jgi:outer membrane protein OmpA-like peptidoglycan-associated protein
MAQVRFRLSSSFVLALAFSAMPLGTAFAQSGSQVRVTAEESRIRTFQLAKNDLVMTAPRGTVFTVIHTAGDKYRHDERNWYWVLLPRDAWGTQRSGWISGRDIEELPPAPPAPPAVPEVEHVPAATAPAAPAPAAAEAPATIPVDEDVDPVVSEVILNFKFAKSDLTAEAKGRLAGAVAMLNGNTDIAIALEGHADAIGSEPFNEKLGMARAETVKRYLAEQYEIAADRIVVVSYGENQPAAPNDTPTGRAQNRRVVVKVAR